MSQTNSAAVFGSSFPTDLDMAAQVGVYLKPERDTINVVRVPTLYNTLKDNYIQHTGFLPACGAGDLAIGSWNWAARPALISAYLQKLCARLLEGTAYRCNFLQAEACSRSMIRGASHVHASGICYQILELLTLQSGWHGIYSMPLTSGRAAHTAR